MIDKKLELKRLKGSPLTKLNFGCGGYPLEGWTNIDGGDGKVWSAPAAQEVIKLDAFDAVRSLPDQCAEYIFSEQFFEHFDRPTGLSLLKEWFRLLKTGGVLRIQTPDLRKEAMIYLGLLDYVDWQKDVVPRRLSQLRQSSESYCKLAEGEQYTHAMLLNNGMHLDGHLFLYDFETLEQSMRLAGFEKVRQVEFGQSEHTALEGVNRHDGGPTGRHWIPKIVLEVEGTRL